MHRKPTKIQALLLKLLQRLSSVQPQAVHCSSVDFYFLCLRTGPLLYIGYGKVVYYILFLQGVLTTAYILVFKIIPLIRQKYIIQKLYSIL